MGVVEVLVLSIFAAVLLAAAATRLTVLYTDSGSVWHLWGAVLSGAAVVTASVLAGGSLLILWFFDRLAEAWS